MNCRVKERSREREQKREGENQLRGELGCTERKMEGEKEV